MKLTVRMTKVYKAVIKAELPPIVVGEFEYPNDPRSYVAWGFMPLVGSPMVNRSEVTGQTKSGSEDSYGQCQNKDRDVARYGAAGAPPWSQAWGWGSQASAWWSGLFPRGPTGLSPKGRRGPALLWIHHLQRGP